MISSDITLLKRLPSSSDAGLDYRDLCNILRRHNMRISNSAGKMINNPVDRSSTAVFRDYVISNSGILNSFPRNECLGIVLYVPPPHTTNTDRKIQEIYIHVPLYDFDVIIHPDEFDPTKLGTNTRQYKNLIFYPESDSLLAKEAPVARSIARVRIPPNYATGGNPQDNKYLGLLAGTQLVIAPATTTQIAPPEPVALEYAKSVGLKRFFSYKPSGISTVEPDNQLSLPVPPNVPIISFVDPQRKLRNSNPRLHAGLDFSCSTGTPIYAPVDMIITSVTIPDPTKKIFVPPRGPAGSFNVLEINIKAKSLDGKYSYIFRHLSKIIVPSGKVSRGATIALSGDTGFTTGPHLHFEVYQGGKVVNPIYLFKPTSILVGGIATQFSLSAAEANPLIEIRGNKRYLRVPVPLGTTTPVISKPSPPKQSPAVNQPQVAQTQPVTAVSSAEPEPQPQPEAEVEPELEAEAEKTVPKNYKEPEEPTKGSVGLNASMPVNRPKMLLKPFTVDRANGIRDNFKIGSNSIYVREDIYGDLSTIKQRLNRFNIALTCVAQEININNNKISLLTKAGLGFSLNKFAGLTQNMNLITDDYYIGPNYNKPLGRGYKLNIYAAARKNAQFLREDNPPESMIVDIYDIRQTYLKGSPKIIKVNKFFINLTELFESYGFRQVDPNPLFFSNSNFELSNWFLIEKPSKLQKGYSYKELLETIYPVDFNSIWKEPELIWDGSKFIDA